MRSAHSTPSSTLPPLALEDETTQPNTALSPVSREEVERVVGLARSEPGQECSFSQVLLTELIHSTGSPHIQRPQSTASDSSKVAIPSDIAADLDTSSVPLTSRDKAESLTRAYFQFTSLNLPLLHEPTFREKLDLVYSMPTAVHLRDLAELQTDAKSRIAIFFVLEVFAVALLRMQKQDPSRISTSLADRYHKTALDALNLVSLPNDVEGVQALLLIALYSYHHPNLWATWRTVGAALRLAVELGLHQDVSDGLDPLALDTRRRAFWVPYSMDRNLSAAMSLPSGLSDGAISTQVCLASFWSRAASTEAVSVSQRRSRRVHHPLRNHLNLTLLAKDLRTPHVPLPPNPIRATIHALGTAPSLCPNRPWRVAVSNAWAYRRLVQQHAHPRRSK